MNENTYESGECTDDGLSDSSANSTSCIRNISNDIRKKNKRKKRQKQKKSFLETKNYYRSIRQQFFNPYIFQRIEIEKNFRSTTLLTDLLNGIGIKKNIKVGKILNNEPKFSIKKLDFKNYEYLSFITFNRNECYSPDPYNPIKISLKSNLKAYTGDTKLLENYFEIINKDQINEKPKSSVPKLCEEIDSSPSWPDFLLKIGISNDVVDDLMKIILMKNLPVPPIKKIDLEKFQILKNSKELSDDDMDISEDEFENIPIVIDNTLNYDDKNLNELRNNNSLYMSNYSPEHISYYDFVTNFGLKTSTSQMFYEDTFKY